MITDGRVVAAESPAFDLDENSQGGRAAQHCHCHLKRRDKKEGKKGLERHEERVTL